MRKVCQFVGRCDGHGGDLRRLCGGVTVVAVLKGGVMSIRKVCQFVGRCVGHGGCKGLWEGVITFMRRDSPKGGVKDVRKVCPLMERCDAHGRSLQELGEV